MPNDCVESGSHILLSLTYHQPPPAAWNTFADIWVHVEKLIKTLLSGLALGLSKLIMKSNPRLFLCSEPINRHWWERPSHRPNVPDVLSRSYHMMVTIKCKRSRCRESLMKLSRWHIQVSVSAQGMRHIVVMSHTVLYSWCHLVAAQNHRKMCTEHWKFSKILEKCLILCLLFAVL